MFREEKSKMGCTRNSWVKDTYLDWFGFVIRHNNEPSEVRKFCGDCCSFPSCVVASIRSNEAPATKAGLPDGDGIAQERAASRASTDKSDSETALVQGHLC